MPPTHVWLHKKKQIAGALPFVLIVITCRTPRPYGQAGSHFRDDLVGTFIKAYSGPLWVFRFGVEVQYVFHIIDIL